MSNITYEELRNEAQFSGDTEKIWYSNVTNAKLKHYKDEYCVYMIECDGEIVYIGSSSNLPYRLESHKYKLSFDCVYIGRTIGDLRDMLFMESYLIGIAEPSLNFSDYTTKNFKSKNYNYILQHINYNCA